MSKKRNQVLFTKPEDPKFLKLIKQQAGYRDEGPTVDTKRAKFENANSEDEADYVSDNEEEQPQIVVISSGDLTAEEALQEKQRLELESETKPADLTERIVFKSRSKQPATDTDVPSQSEVQTAAEQQLVKGCAPKPKKSARKPAESKLSFAFEDDDDDEEQD